MYMILSTALQHSSDNTVQCASFYVQLFKHKGISMAIIPRHMWASSVLSLANAVSDTTTIS